MAHLATPSPQPAPLQSADQPMGLCSLSEEMSGPVWQLTCFRRSFQIALVYTPSAGIEDCNSGMFVDFDRSAPMVLHLSNQFLSAHGDSTCSVQWWPSLIVSGLGEVARWLPHRQALTLKAEASGYQLDQGARTAVGHGDGILARTPLVKLCQAKLPTHPPWSGCSGVAGHAPAIADRSYERIPPFGHWVFILVLHLSLFIF